MDRNRCFGNGHRLRACVADRDSHSRGSSDCRAPCVWTGGATLSRAGTHLRWHDYLLAVRGEAFGQSRQDRQRLRPDLRAWRCVVRAGGWRPRSCTAWGPGLAEEVCRAACARRGYAAPGDDRSLVHRPCELTGRAATTVQSWFLRPGLMRRSFPCPPQLPAQPGSALKGAHRPRAHPIYRRSFSPRWSAALR